MWNTLLSRLMGRQPVPPAPLRSSRPGPAQEQQETRPAPAAPDVAPSVVGARRPLVATDGSLAGFEFHVSPVLLERLRRQEDQIAARALTSGVLAAMRLSLAPGRIAFAELPARWLAAVADDAAFAPGMMLLTSRDADAALAARLRQLKVSLGWRPAEVPAGLKPDFLLATAAQSQGFPAWPGVPLVLLDAPDVDAMEALLCPPVTLAACRAAAHAEPANAQSLSPQVQRLMSLLARLVRDDDHTALVAEIKADASLALRLLQHMNSAGATPGRTLDSIDDAVLVLGRVALYRWCSHMLVRMGPTRPAAAALQALALSRARLFEQLARRAGDPAPGRFYLLGLASLLPQLLRSSAADALTALQLPAEALQALLHFTGPWADYIALAQALEQPDMEAARPLATRFGGLPLVLEDVSRSWA